MENLKNELFKIMEEKDYMDQDLAADVEAFVELEYDGMFEKELKDDNKRIRKIWFEFCYDENKERYLKEFNLI